MSERPRFHLAFPVHSLEAARAFYGGILGCAEGRSSPEWVDFDFFGHQIVAHLSAEEGGCEGANEVDGEQVPVRHFGVILTPCKFKEISENLLAKKIVFIIEPQVRFKGQAGEQFTMFLRDPSGNALEFKAFENENSIFAKD
ncbi:MAG: VOC family protein [Micropepsaceae bacterium]